MFTKWIFRQRKIIVRNGFIPLGAVLQTPTQECPCCAQKYMLLSYYLSQSWQNYSRNYSDQQHRSFSVGVPLDIFRCYQPCHITSCVLPSTGANVHLNLDQVLEQLMLLPSKGQSGRMKDSYLKNLWKKKKLVRIWWGQSLSKKKKLSSEMLQPL